MIDLITVVFRDEIPLLQIQAQSIAEYIPAGELNSIIVVVNDSADVVDLIDTAWWKQYQDRVRISVRTFESRINGWESQQLCKLLAASQAECKWSVVLDTKTWFVRPFAMLDIVDSQGRPRVGFGRLSKIGIEDHTRHYIENLYRLNELPHVIGPAGVPFFFHTETVQNMISEHDDFVEFFQTNVRYPNLITEFVLYSGYVKSKYGSFDVLYDTISIPPFIALNIADYEAPDFDYRFNLIVTEPKVLTASLHRKAYAQLSPEQLARWQDFLIDRKLTVTKFTF